MSLPPLKTFDGTTLETVAALPEGGYGAGLILIDDGFLSKERLEALCGDFSHEGYIALSPLLFSESSAPFDPEKGARDLLSVIAYMRKVPGCGGKVGTIGFGRGALLSYLMATRCDVDCAVIYGGEQIGGFSGEISDIRRPTLIHTGAGDPQQSAAGARLLRSLRRNASIAPMLYEGIAPDFYRAEAAGFNAEAARQAHSQTMAFLAENLNG